MFKTMLPGPLATLHFTKVDLGQVPMRLSNVLATKTETKGIKLDMDVDWDGQCDIDLDADYIPALVSSFTLLAWPSRPTVASGPLAPITLALCSRMPKRVLAYRL